MGIRGPLEGDTFIVETIGQNSSVARHAGLRRPMR
jgi:hypothetical protein